MADYQSTYTGEQMDALWGKAASANQGVKVDGVELTPDADKKVNVVLSGKVDKVEGKGLSENDYTTAEKTKLAGIEAGAEVNVQSDWNAASGDAAILNKPTKLSDFTNDSGFITKAVSDLTNYYLKNETYTKAEVNALIAEISGFEIVVVATLPVASASTMKKMYLVPSDRPETSNLYSEYITVLVEGVYSWELVGGATIDLSDYYTKTQSDAKFVEKVSGKGLSQNDYSDTEKGKVASAYADKHTHSNKSELDLIASGDKAKWDAKQNAINDLADIRSGASAGATAVQPAAIADFITRSVNDLLYYYKKTETYTQAEVNALIGAIQSFHYEIVAVLPSTGEGNVLYLLGPTGTGADRYEEYVYANSAWTKIGDTSIDLSGYATITMLNTALANYTTTADLTVLLAGKQDKIDADHKLAYSLISGTPTIPTKTSDLTNDSGFLTQHQSLAAYRTSAAQDAIDAGKEDSLQWLTDAEINAMFV